MTRMLSTTVDADGRWSVEAPELAEGDYKVTATTEDAAGNSSTANATGEVDTAAPTLTIDTLGSGNETAPTISGTGEKDALIELTIVDGDGVTRSEGRRVGEEGRRRCRARWSARLRNLRLQCRSQCPYPFRHLLR